MSDLLFALIEKLFTWQGILIFFTLAIVIDFCIAKFVYHDVGCMVAECRKFKN